MFCMNCGTKLPDGAKFCFNCGAKVLDQLNPNAVAQTVAAGSSQDNEPVEEGVKEPVDESINVKEDKVYPIGTNHEVRFSDKVYQYITLKKPFIQLSFDLVNKFKEYWYSQVSSLSFKALIDNINPFWGARLHEALSLGVNTLMENGIDYVDTEALSKMIYADIEKLMIDYLTEKAKPLADLKAQLQAESEAPGPWVGGGFGMTGAIKGAIKAEVLNVGTSALSGAFNWLTNNTDNDKFRRLENKIMDEIKEEHRYEDALSKLTLEVFDRVYEILVKEGIKESVSFNHAKARGKFNNMMRMMNQDTNENTDPLAVACSCIEIDPYCDEYYITLYRFLLILSQNTEGFIDLVHDIGLITDEKLAAIKQSAFENLFLSNPEAKVREALIKCVTPNDAKLLFILGLFYLNGYGVKDGIDPNAADENMWAALNAGYLPAACFLIKEGLGLEMREELERKNHSLNDIYALAMHEDDVFAQYAMGEVYRRGYFLVKADKYRAKSFYEMAADHGFCDAMFELAMIQYNELKEEGVHPDGYSERRVYKVYKLFESSCKTRSAKSLFGFSHFLLNYYKSFESSAVQESLKYQLAAAEQGYLPAMIEVGWRYYKGVGVAISVQEAEKWLYAAHLFNVNHPEKVTDRFSSDRHKKDGEYNYAEFLLKENRVDEAVQEFQLAAQEDENGLGGSLVAQERLGELYENGIGVEKSLEIAYEWYKKSAQHGSWKAIGKVDELEQKFKLEKEEIPGESLFNNGNYAEALPLLQQAYSQGGTVSGKAALYIGIMCAQGLGVQVNLTNAKAWLDIAVQMGDEDTKRIAKDWIGRLFGQ